MAMGKRDRKKGLNKAIATDDELCFGSTYCVHAKTVVSKKIRNTLVPKIHKSKWHSLCLNLSRFYSLVCVNVSMASRIWSWV